ncbi:hypothetical protein RI129_008420 [Pyrocoelia pectoralis]|uniref:Protein arginine N-methyltransferase n=1 Tax=Pyrocoelia pectoralis TaxID=417401 RepID=A0AAN7V8K9_9COLE
MQGDNGTAQKKKRMSCGLEIDCPKCIKIALQDASNDGFHFVVTYAIHPQFARDVTGSKVPYLISRTDRLLSSTDWSRLIVGKINDDALDVDSDIPHVAFKSKALLSQELGFAVHLGLPATMIKLPQAKNPIGAHQIWINLPMVHPSRYSSICDEEENMWERWNHFRTYCCYDRRIGLALDLPNIQHLPSQLEIDRWVGEPQFVLSKPHQDIIRKFMNLDVQYIIRGPHPKGGDYKKYTSYINFLGKKLFESNATTEYIQGCEDYLQSPLQPLTENLESMIYEVFEKDQVKYIEYQRAIQTALHDLPQTGEMPVVIVVGAGRGPLVQAALNASYLLHRPIKLYALEKNPYAINTLQDRIINEWHERVTLVRGDMRYIEITEKADILVSELLGSFGDNELSPECLDGAQRFLKPNGISIPTSYTSFLAPLQSTKIYNEILNNRPHDKSIQNIYETPYIVHLVNYYQISPSQEVYTFTHPNWNKEIDNDRFGQLEFVASQSCLLTGFIGYFETVLYKNVMLSINPQTYSEGMVSWFPIIFSLMEPVYVKEGEKIKMSFWRMHAEDKVWYQWCLDSPIQTGMINPNGRSFFIKTH